MIKRKECWGEDRLLCFDENGKYRRFILSWTDYAPLDPFTDASDGRAFITDKHAIELSGLLDYLSKDMST